MTDEERIAHIAQLQDGLRGVWSLLLVELDAQIASKTEQLINNDNEQTRGQIKALRWVKELPETLQVERSGMESALAELAADD